MTDSEYRHSSAARTKARKKCEQERTEAIKRFASKWLERFNDPDVQYIELVDHWMADDCRALGFEMDCGEAFCKDYPVAFIDCDALSTVIGKITDISMLGSAVYSKWRYYNHWAYSGSEILEPKNRKWFILVLERLKELSETDIPRTQPSQRPKQMLEKMGDFFETRLDGYEEHQLTCIESAEEFYPFTASCLPQTETANVLDLGCGTGLELGFYFETAPTAKVTGIDLAPAMLSVLRKKFPGKALTLIEGSYFDVPFEENTFDAAVSVESLHHFTKEEKIPLYEKVEWALKPGGFFILTDYFAASDEEEQSRRAELLRLKEEQDIHDDEFYHFDTPLTVAHEKEALLAAGFSSVEVLQNWGPTYTLKAIR